MFLYFYKFGDFFLLFISRNGLFTFTKRVAFYTVTKNQKEINKCLKEQENFLPYSLMLP